MLSESVCWCVLCPLHSKFRDRSRIYATLHIILTPLKDFPTSIYIYIYILFPTVSHENMADTRPLKAEAMLAPLVCGSCTDEWGNICLVLSKYFYRRSAKRFRPC